MAMRYYPTVFRLACCIAALAALGATAAPCEAQPESAVQRQCAAELAGLERRLLELRERLTDLHPEVRAVQRSIDEKRECAAAVPAGVPGEADITVDLGAPRQAFMGFGATWPFSAIEAGFSDSQWRRAVGVLVDIGARTGAAPPILEPREGGREVPGFPKPLTFAATEKILGEFRRSAPSGAEDLFPFAAINVRWAHPWLRAARSEDYRGYLDLVAAKAVAAVEDWKVRTGREPEFLQLWNEPISGNGELNGGTLDELVQTIKVASKRLREAGFERVRFVVPAEETVRETLTALRAIAADGEALAAVGAIAYHVYPYGSEYAYLPRMLATRAQGRDFDLPMRERLQLRGLAEQLRLPLWMTEVSNGFTRDGPGKATDIDSPDGIDWIVGRAVHIHDEMRYAGASAYFGMMAIWSNLQERDTSPGSAARLLRAQGDNLVLVDSGRDAVFAGGIGHAIGHYGRWLHRGARYLESASSNPMVLVSAFREGDRMVSVLVNMARAPVPVRLRAGGGEFAGAAQGEQTRAGTCRAPLAALEPVDGHLRIELPAWSVTTLAAPLREGAR